MVRRCGDGEEGEGVVAHHPGAVGFEVVAVGGLEGELAECGDVQPYLGDQPAGKNGDGDGGQPGWQDASEEVGAADGAVYAVVFPSVTIVRPDETADSLTSKDSLP